jgi:hypothetical protein
LFGSFNADAPEWHPQFYEAYAHLAVPFLGIPGNHDGDTTDDPARKPLDTWMANFCAPRRRCRRPTRNTVATSRPSPTATGRSGAMR